METKIRKFGYFKIKHILKEEKQLSDLLWKLGNPVRILVLKLIRAIIKELEVMEVDDEQNPNWVDPFNQYMKIGVILHRVKD